ncbi:unnamed protein product [Vitrella brassicaformis CCMP3155]|uniref:NAD(P)(+)--arginine ADP-ribosyltransferase n=1 Tax=Vitrella brassicaformis (strain CCMP3155) TaxID=1169540 RepID=A0A0G4G206_VITBC|nr:unnamed protein product [Vitrella brassicaformis CCMP3155]|eukprot:CEM22097.1 unnamed protein product [Vitrella brassicaformis CCMP3155]
MPAFDEVVEGYPHTLSDAVMLADLEKCGLRDADGPPLKGMLATARRLRRALVRFTSAFATYRTTISGRPAMATSSAPPAPSLAWHVACTPLPHPLSPAFDEHLKGSVRSDGMGQLGPLGKELKDAYKEYLSACVRLYTGESYKELNRALREDDRVQLRRYAPYILCLREAFRSDISLLTPFTKSSFRGVSHTRDQLAACTPGAVVSWTAFSSSSTRKGVAENFCKGVTFHIRCESGGGSGSGEVACYRPCKISHLSSHPNEYEVLLPCNCSLRVVKVSKDACNTNIEMEVVGFPAVSRPASEQTLADEPADAGGGGDSNGEEGRGVRGWISRLIITLTRREGKI